MNYIVKISRGTTKEDELFDYIKASSYLKANKKSYSNKDNFEISL